MWITIWFIWGKQTKKEIIPYPICSVVAVFKMLIRILNMLRSRIWDMVLFLFSDYLLFGFRRKLVFRFEEEWGDRLEVYGFHPNRSSRRGIFSYGKIVLWLKIIIFWRIPFSFQHKSLICYLSQLTLTRITRQVSRRLCTHQISIFVWEKYVVFPGVYSFY